MLLKCVLMSSSKTVLIASILEVQQLIHEQAELLVRMPAGEERDLVEDTLNCLWRTVKERAGRLNGF